jgi:hypothetical protein
MAYASASNGSTKKGCPGEPSGKGNNATYASKAGSAGASSEPGSSMGGGGMTTKGNAKKLNGNGR